MVMQLSTGLPKRTVGRVWGRLWLLLVLATFATGCSDRLSSLRGVVTIDGQPAPKGLAFEFSPVGAGSSSYASTDGEGRYEAAFTFRRKGIEPGEHLVRLLPSQIEMPMPKIGANGRPVEVSEQRSPVGKLPREYYERITTIVISPGSNSYDFELTTGSQ